VVRLFLNLRDFNWNFRVWEENEGVAGGGGLAIELKGAGLEFVGGLHERSFSR